MHSNKGVITVFIALMLTAILSFGTLVLEAGRLQAAKTQLAEANISASTSMIAAYDATLYEKYGLLAIDTEFFTPERYMDYLYYNSDMSAQFPGNRVTRMYTIDNVELTGLYNLSTPSMLKRQMLARAKYNVVPQDHALNMYTLPAFFAELKSKCGYVAQALASPAIGSISTGSLADIDPEVLAALTDLYETYKDIKRYDELCNTVLSGSTMSILPSHTGTSVSNAPVEDVEAIANALNDVSAVLGGEGSSLQLTSGTPMQEIDVNVDVGVMAEITEALKDITSVQTQIPTVTKQIAYKCRYMAQSISAAIDALSVDTDGNLLLNTYVSAFYSDRLNKVEGYSGPAKGAGMQGAANGAFTSACTEYIFGGSASEQQNQEAAYNYIAAIRFINELYSTLVSSQSYNEDNYFSVAAHLAWANFETITDIQIMTVHETAVPFAKNGMILDITQPSIVAQAFSTFNADEALHTLGYSDGTNYSVPGVDPYTYSDSIAAALWLMPNSLKMMRAADLIQIEMRYHEQYIEGKAATFLMSEQNTFCRAKCTAKLNSLLPVVSLGNGGLMNVKLTSIKYGGY